jgi:hypothetical protein
MNAKIVFSFFSFSSSSFYLFMFLVVLDFELKVLELARQMLYHLNHEPSPEVTLEA